jgi:hypothetical protein
MGELQLLVNAFAGSVGTLFHQPEFFRMHAGGRGLFFELSDGRNVRASIHFTEIEDGVWRSPARGTFAGYAAEDLAPDELASMHERVEARLAESGASRIEILPAPQAHDPVLFANSVYLLLSRGYSIVQQDLNQAIEIGEGPFEERISYGQRKRLRKCGREGLVARPLPSSALAEAYDVIAENRASKGYMVSMTLAQLEQMAETFPDRIVLFGVPASDRLAAAAICLRLTPDILYVFYWGDRPGYSATSPVVALADALYSWCRDEGVRLLDIGTSTIGATPNPGLIAFKRGLGCTESLKLRLGRTL